MGPLVVILYAELEVCKSNQKTTEERAKSAEAKIVNLNAQLQSLHEILREEQNRKLTINNNNIS